MNTASRTKAIFLSLSLASLTLVSISGCSGSGEPTVIAPTENFQEDPAVAAEKAKAMAESQNQPL